MSEPTITRSSVFTLEVQDPQAATKLAGLLPHVIDHGRVKVSFRARGDQEATRIATEALAAAGEVRPAELTTGLGIHKRVVAVQDGRCPEHPAYEADYCPVCGTARVIGQG